MKKLVTHSLPPQVTPESGEDHVTALEKALLLQARRLETDDLRRPIAQARALGDLGQTPDELAGKDPLAVVESLFGKMPKERTKKRRTATRTR